MKSVVDFALNFSAKAYRGTRPAGDLLIVPHEFRANDDGCLEHFIDGRLRAVVPPEGFDGYAETWPGCLPVLKSLKAAEKSAGATAAAGEPAAVNLAAGDAPGI